MNTLVLAYDGSPDARAAIHAAAALFPGARAIVVTVSRELGGRQDPSAAARVAVPDDVINAAMATLNAADEREARAIAAEGSGLATEAGLAAEPRTAGEPRAPWHGIRRVAAEADAALVVCGSRGRGPLSRAALGSTSSALLHHAGRPVLVVPKAGSVGPGPLAIGYDGSPPAREAIATAARLLPGREAVVIDVWESLAQHSLGGRAMAAIPVFELQAFSRDLDAYVGGIAAAVAEEGAEAAEAGGLEARAATFEAAGAAWRGLLAGAGTHGAAAVVVGSRGRNALTANLLGSVASGLVHNADRPVLVVPPAPAANH